MTDILQKTSTDIVEDFQNAYYNQIGRRMQIGSEEYTLSSIFVYVLAIYTALINNSYKNQVLDTASGQFLDNIASRYGLTRSPRTYFNPWFEGIFTINSECEYSGRSFDIGALSINVNNHTYTNTTALFELRTDMIRFMCTEKHSDYLNKSELYTALSQVKDSNDKPVFNLTNTKQSDYTDLQSISNELSDEDFRKYIKQSKYLYNPGVASSFEAVAKNSSPNIVDARVRVQGDTGFVPGNVDLYCKCYNMVANDQYKSMAIHLDNNAVYDAIKEMNITVIGQNVKVKFATPIEDSRQYVFFIPKVYKSTQYENLYRLKFNAVCDYLNNTMKINESFMPSMVLNLMLKPLSEISNNPEDYGYSIEDTQYIEFDKYKDLPVLGLESVSTYTKRDCDPTTYILLKNDVDFSYI